MVLYTCCGDTLVSTPNTIVSEYFLMGLQVVSTSQKLHPCPRRMEKVGVMSISGHIYLTQRFSIPTI